MIHYLKLGIAIHIFSLYIASVFLMIIIQTQSKKNTITHQNLTKSLLYSKRAFFMVFVVYQTILPSKNSR
jgi:hypothetical protein